MFVVVPAAAVAALVNGSIYAVGVSVADVYGNAAGTASGTVVVGTTLPTLTVDPVAADGVINGTEHGAAVTVSGTTTAAVGQTVTVTLNGQSYTGTVVTGGTWAATVPAAAVAALTDGSYPIGVSVTDAIGNTNTATGNTITVDTTPPTLTLNAPGGDSVVNATEHTQALVLTGTSDAPSGQAVTVTFNGQTYTGAVGTGGVWTATIPASVISALADGGYSVGVSVGDEHGNTRALNPVPGITVDTTGPTLTFNPLVTDDVLNVDEEIAGVISFSGTSSAVGQTVNVSVDGSGLIGVIVQPDGTWSFDFPVFAFNPVEGDVYAYTAVVTDAQGNTATANRTLTIHNTTPTLTLNPPAGDGTLNASEQATGITLTGTTSAGVAGTVAVTFGGTTYAATVHAGGIWSLALPAAALAPLANGSSNPVVVTTTDAYGNESYDVTQTVQVNTTAPTLTLDPVGASDAIDVAEASGPLAIGGTSSAPVGSTVTVTLDGQAYTGLVGEGGVWSAAVPLSALRALAGGSYAISATVTDTIGNTSPLFSHTVAVTGTAPTVRLDPASDSGIPDNNVTNVTRPTLTGRAGSLATVSIVVDGQAVGTAAAAADGAWTYTFADPITPGVHGIQVSQTFASGALSQLSPALLLTETTPRNQSDFAPEEPAFDRAWYLAHYADVAASGMDPLKHWQTFGWREGRNPDAVFDTNWYLDHNPDVRAAGIDPLRHYEMSGAREGRDPSASFSTSAYLDHHTDVAIIGPDALSHYLHFGEAENRATFISSISGMPSSRPLPAHVFDVDYYRAHNPDVAASGVDPATHYAAFGWKEGRNPDALFDTNWYLANYQDVAAAGLNPLQHYETFGWREGRDPGPGFSTRGYLASHPDVAAAGINPLEHRLQFG